MHIGECGLHHHNQNCENLTLIDELNTLIKTSTLKLYPKTVKIKTLNNEKANRKKQDILNGGWSDKRDHELCLSFVNS